ncbi:MAG TPA: hypothetical protein VH008_26705 [Pseudonocardia sp.]|jgi:uncharacterized membrane-anchored protein|nr:hypothetical protein [Pseudonocardia sp.]
MTSHHAVVPSRRLLNKVPEITLYFWVVKVLCTTVGESAADFLNVNLNFGLTGTSIVTGVLLAVAMVVQFRADRYVPGRYWLAVALVSVFGTLVTDNLTDSIGVPLEASTLIFGVLLAVTFAVWYRTERTLSIHSIVTARREAFYWLAILFTFALGTATGDLMAEVLGLGYLVTGAIVATLIAMAAVGWRFGLNSVLAFWFIYILTRPLGASIGDYLSQSTSQGGLGLGATVTSLIFVLGILGIVTYLAVTKADVIRTEADDPVLAAAVASERGGLWQTVAVLALVLVAGGAGYSVRKSALESDTPEPAAAVVSMPGTPGADPAARAVPGAVAAAAPSPLGDLSAFRTITQDTLRLLNSGDQSGATTRVDDLETEWDNAEARLRPKDRAAWTTIDGKIDTVLRELRATSPKPASEKAALTGLLAALG